MMWYVELVYTHTYRTITRSVAAFLFKQFSFSSYNHKIKYSENLIRIQVVIRPVQHNAQSKAKCDTIV